MSPAAMKSRAPTSPAHHSLALLLLLLARGLLSEPLLESASQEASSLESASVEDGDDAPSAEPPEGCCVRSPKMEPLHDGEGGIVDVGRCARSCRHGASAADASWDASWDASEEAESGACPGAWRCEEARAALRREATSDGRVRELRVLEACACRARDAPCARRPLALRLFPDSPFETSVDVGSCSGHCQRGGGCRAVHSRSVAVAGPNGAQCVPVVERCECRPACYRARSLEVVHDYAGDHGALLQHPVVKEVDVGTCVGSCEGAAAAGHCADPFWRAGQPCRSWLYASRARAATCVAAATSTRRYTERDGERRRIVVVESCACK